VRPLLFSIARSLPCSLLFPLSGHRHFTSLCLALTPPLDPVQTFRREVSQHFYGAVRGPFNQEDREKAGLGREWYEELGGRGVSNKVVEKEAEKVLDEVVRRREVETVEVVLEVAGE
jgi:hypothetical protein